MPHQILFDPVATQIFPQCDFTLSGRLPQNSALPKFEALSTAIPISNRRFCTGLTGLITLKSCVSAMSELPEAPTHLVTFSQTQETCSGEEKPNT